MVSKRSRAATTSATSRERLLAAARRTFAVHGYDGAGVDAIARVARLNKAMIYYHFGSKAGLYQAIVRDVFETVLADAREVADGPGTPVEKVRRFVRGVAETAGSRPHFAPVWLREFSDGARHLDRSTLRLAGQVVATLGRILEEGERAGTFRRVSPALVHISIVAPLLLFMVSGRARERLARADLPALRDLTLEAFVAHVTSATLGSLLRTADEVSHA
jgi:TetR/AcrR family transcriptional regulator